MLTPMLRALVLVSLSSEYLGQGRPGPGICCYRGPGARIFPPEKTSPPSPPKIIIVRICDASGRIKIENAAASALLQRDIKQLQGRAAANLQNCSG